MNITNITDGYDDMKLYNCSNNDSNIEIIIPLFAIIPCIISFLCLLSLMIYTLIKRLIRKK